MIVIASKTEYRLRDDLRKFLRYKPKQRCFFLKFSGCDIAKDKLFETFLMMLEDIPNSYMAKVYLCRDKDILILMEGFMQRQFLDFVKELSRNLAIDNFEELINIFEIGQHWEELQGLYESKINAIDEALEAEKERQRKEIADQKTSEIVLELDHALISSIKERRENRTHPLAMIADDDQMSRTLAGNVLRGDYDCTFARNGTEALKDYVAAAPDILFLDIGMPDIGGHEVLETLFQIDPDAYIIMFSGRRDKGTVLKSLELGAQGFLGKPFTRDEIFSHVENSPYIQNKTSSAA